MRTRTDIINDIHNNNIFLEKREIFLSTSQAEEKYTEINPELAINFLKNLRYLESLGDEDILIHLYSSGGDWDAGMSIYDTIKQSKCKINILCHGMVASIATTILQAADYRVAMPNCQFMIHEGQTGISDELTSKSAQSWLSFERKIEETFYNIYTDRCIDGPFFQTNKSKKDQILNFLKTQLNKYQDWWLDVEEATNYGFIDDIFGSKTCKLNLK